jgi:hypothetical protein
MTTEKDNQRVSDAYREIASEATRPEIDERILKLAGSGLRSRYGLARAWVRPLAWAATIALSVALVLELTQQVDVPSAGVQQDVQAEPARSDADLPTASEEMDVQLDAAKRMPPARPEAAAPAALSADDFAPLREAEEQAKMRSADAPARCNADERATADRWYACIEELLENEYFAAAEQELEAFNLAHPDFERPPE